MTTQPWKALGIAGLLVALGLFLLPERDTFAPKPTARELKERITRPEPEKGTLRIQGTVVGENGPIAGALVSAIRSKPGWRLVDKLECPPPGARPIPERANVSLGQCGRQAPLFLIEKMQTRDGEATVYAWVHASPEGHFTLEGLPAGDFVLDVRSTQGAVQKQGVPAGTESVELELDTPRVASATVVDESGKPLAGVRVRLTPLPEALAFDTVTDLQGRFHVGPVPEAERYLVLFEKEGWSPEVQVRTELLYGWSESVVLRRPLLLTGRVMDQGKPVSGVQVHVGTRDLPEDTTQRHATTDEQGRFTFEPLPPTAYKVWASHGNRHAVTNVPLERAAQPIELTLSGELVVVRGTVKAQDGAAFASARLTLSNPGDRLRFHARSDDSGRFQFEPVPPSKNYVLQGSAPHHLDTPGIPVPATRDVDALDVTLRRKPRVEGLLVDSNGAALANQPFYLRQTDHVFLLDEGPALTARDRFRTDSEGRFSLELPAQVHFELVLREDSPYEAAPQPVTAPASQVRWVAKPTTRGSITGHVHDEQGQPLAGVEIRARPNPITTDDWPRAATDASGTYVLHGLQPGHYDVQALFRAPRSGLRAASRSVEVRSAERATVDLRLEAGWTLSGDIVDTRGRPVGEVSLSVADLDLAKDQSLHEATIPVLADREGRFEVPHVQGQHLELNVLHPTLRLSPRLSRGVQPDIQRGRVSASQPRVRLVLEPKATIHGRVVSADGRPVTRFIVGTSNTTDPKGAFVQTVEHVGEHVVRISADGLGATVRRATVRRVGEVVDLGEIRLGQRRQVTGFVLDAETSAPVAGAVVHAAFSHDDTTPASRATTQENGAFLLESVDDALDQFHVTAPGYAPRAFPLKPGRQQELVARITKGAHVSVSALDMRGQSTDALVLLDAEPSGTNTPDVAPIQVNPGEPVVVRGLAPGRYRVQGHSFRAGALGAQYLEVPASGEVSLTLRAIPSAATLHLRVDGPQRAQPYLFHGPLLASPRRWLPMSLGLRRQALSSVESPDGTLTFEKVPSGEVTLILVDEERRAFSRETFDIPAEGPVFREVTPAWKPLDDLKP